jgi:poly(hydroxyalkanoate) depolymerase family esterase
MWTLSNVKWPRISLLTMAMVAAVVLFTPQDVTYADSGTWQQFTYSGPTGSRNYYVYTPVHYHVGTSVPMIMMLHGCMQTPADFAAGTGMNDLADEHNFIVVYPDQTSQYNGSGCWNWFDPVSQVRGGGEAAIIAGIAAQVENNTSRWTVDKNRVYVAGMSAGAAMSVIMGATYPDIFAAIGVHSGLEYQAGTSLFSGATAMAFGGPAPTQQGQAAYNAMGKYARAVPIIVFHGSADTTVNPVNGQQVVEQWMETDHLASKAFNAQFPSPDNTISGLSPGGQSYTVEKWNDERGHEVEEYWVVNGMGHAWSGGNLSGSFTDPLGPSASQAMYEFFMNHPRD